MRFFSWLFDLDIVMYDSCIVISVIFISIVYNGFSCFIIVSPNMDFSIPCQCWIAKKINRKIYSDSTIISSVFFILNIFHAFSIILSAPFDDVNVFCCPFYFSSSSIACSDIFIHGCDISIPFRFGSVNNINI